MSLLSAEQPDSDILRERCGAGGGGGGGAELCAQLYECGEKKGICAGSLQAVSGHELCVCNIS
nr:MAG TPA: hypothetical protein [Caudoviricetes sp.]